MFLNGSSENVGSSKRMSRIDFPEGVALDWVARNVYWTDSGKKTVEVARIDDPSVRRVLFDEQVKNPRGIAIHPSARYITNYYYRSESYVDKNLLGG